MGIGLISSQKAFLTGVAVTFFVLSWIILAIVTPIVVKSLPEDYFASPDYLAVEGPFSAGVTLPRRLLLLLKNVVAWFLIVIGPFLFQSVFAPFFGLLLADRRLQGQTTANTPFRLDRIRLAGAERPPPPQRPSALHPSPPCD